MAASTITTSTNPWQWTPYWDIIITNDDTWLVFFSGGSTVLKVAKSSDHGATWSIETISITGGNQDQIAVDYDKTNSKVHIFYANGTKSYHKSATNSGTTLTWSSEHTIASLTGGNYISGCILGNGNVLAANSTTVGVLHVYESSDQGVTWGAGTLLISTPITDTIPLLLPLSNSTGDAMVIYKSVSGSSIFYQKRTSGSWGGENTIVSDAITSGTLWRFHVDYDSSFNVYLTYIKSDATLQINKWGGSSWGGNTQLTAATVSDSTHNVDSSGYIWVFYIKSGTIYYRRSIDSGSTYNTEATFLAGETSPALILSGEAHAFNGGGTTYQVVIWRGS